MHRKRTWLGVGGVLCTAALMLASPVGAADAPGRGSANERQFLVGVDGSAARVMAYEREGRITRLYGEAFSHGASPEQSAAAFLAENADLFGVDADDLVPVGPFPDGRHLQPIMYNRDTGQYKFTGVYYGQYLGDIPVFRSRITLLVRNEPGYPLVLAAADLRNLAGFEPAIGPQRLNAGRGIASARTVVPNLVNFTQPELVIWAGVGDLPEQPAMAYAFIGDNGYAPGDPAPEKYLFVTDAVTGDVLHLEDMILNTDVEGNVSGRATEGSKADFCNDEVPMPMKWARVSIGGTFAYADENGDFVIPNPGSDPVDVTSVLRGQWFRVFNQAGGDATITLFDVLPPGPANFMHNDPNTEEYLRAQVNGYHHANLVRDFVIKYNPDYPGLQQPEFPVNVNLNDTCNAFYDYNSINFFRAGGGCANSAFSTVIHHEYGHHLVAMAGSGQGQYGEGMGDVMGTMIMDDPYLAWGFYNDCDDWMRTGDNTMQYPCGGEIHYCGQLLSGCVWSLRNELAILYPDTFIDVLGPLAVNAMLLHGGDLITPQITIDYLTLDDDDGNIFNGTPHYAQIDAAFSAHNMDAPELALLAFEFPDGLPASISPDGGTTVRVLVTGVTEEPQPDTGKLYVNDGGGWTVLDMIEVEPNVYDAVFPAIDCASQVAFYFSADTTSAHTQYWPADAPDTTFFTLSAYGLEVLFADDCNEDLGWTVSGYVVDGPWERGIPITECNRGNPQYDADGSGWCYLTDNSAANACNSDVDDGTTILTSPIMDASGGSAMISYYRWYSNTYGNDPMNDIFEVEVSDDGGATWTNLETVGPGGSEVDGGWFYKEFVVDDFVEPTDQFQIRFKASDLNDGSVVEAGVDGIELKLIDCDGENPADINGDGVVNTEDLLMLLGAWGPCPGCPEDINDDDVVDTADLLLLLGNWG